MSVLPAKQLQATLIQNSNLVYCTVSHIQQSEPDTVSLSLSKKTKTTWQKSEKMRVILPETKSARDASGCFLSTNLSLLPCVHQKQLRSTWKIADGNRGLSLGVRISICLRRPQLTMPYVTNDVTLLLIHALLQRSPMGFESIAGGDIKCHGARPTALHEQR